YPVVDSVIVSLTRWDGIGTARFVGLENYRALLADAPSLLDALWITITFTLVTTCGSAILGFFLAVAVAARVKGWQFFRIAFFVPLLLPLTVVGILWGLLLDPTNGVVNTANSGLGLPAPLWLASTSLALWTIIGVSIWQYTGFPMIVFLAAIEGIPQEL